MTLIKTLWFKDNKYYDYEITGARHRGYRVNTTIKVWHADGTFSIGYQYGEKQFTYDKEELAAKRIADKIRMEENKRRKELLAKLNNLSTAELEKIMAL